MRELIFKTVDGNNPKKREVSIEEQINRSKQNITKKWITKYFVKSQYRAQTDQELQAWLIKNQYKTKPHKECHVLRTIDKETGLTSIVCKVKGEFFAAKDMKAMKILYLNTLKVQMSCKEEGVS